VLSQIKGVFYGAAKIFLQTFAVAVFFVGIAACYVIIRFGWAFAYDVAMTDTKDLLGALIVAPTLCAGGHVLGKTIELFWSPRK
jgi:hypothetical protein